MSKDQSRELAKLKKMKKILKKVRRRGDVKAKIKRAKKLLKAKLGGKTVSAKGQIVTKK